MDASKDDESEKLNRACILRCHNIPARRFRCFLHELIFCFLGRRITYCQLELGDLQAARKDLLSATEVDRSSPRTLFLLFLLHSQQGSAAEAKQVLEELCKSPSFDKDLILVAARHAFQVFVFPLRQFSSGLNTEPHFRDRKP